jgi:hypothetical protein
MPFYLIFEAFTATEHKNPFPSDQTCQYQYPKIQTKEAGYSANKLVSDVQHVGVHLVSNEGGNKGATPTILLCRYSASGWW